MPYHWKARMLAILAMLGSICNIISAKAGVLRESAEFASKGQSSELKPGK